MEKANAQTQIIERDIARLADDHTKLNARFDRHLEIYAQNGKELAKLTSSIDALKETFEKRNERVDTDQNNQWQEIKGIEKDQQTLAIAVNSIVTRSAGWSAVGSAVASAIAVFIVMQVLG